MSDDQLEELAVAIVGMAVLLLLSLGALVTIAVVLDFLLGRAA